jgi:1-acyl-sn-glycerol-3-phosphate acyltransferase
LRFGYWLGKTSVWLILKVLWGLRIEGLNNLPKTGPVIITSNHIAFLDPPVVGVSIYREANFAAKKELFSVPILGFLVKYFNSFPVKRAAFDREALKNSIEALKKGGVLIMFPEGTRSKNGEMMPFRRGIGYIVKKTGATALPAYVQGTNILKKRIFRPGGITIRFGKPLIGLADSFESENEYEDIAAEIQKAVIALKDKSAL